MPAPNLDHPTLARVKAAFSEVKLLATEFRGQTTLIVPPEHLHKIMRFLREDTDCDYDFLSDVTAADYLDYPASMPGRFAVIYLLASYSHGRRLTVKTFLDPSLDTSGNEPDPALEVDSITDIWPGAEWREREVYDLFGIRFRNHPDLRRILLWNGYPAHPLRKDYPLRGRGERENYRILDRESR
ncbi:MAG: NADH-quinone oxidoreductase subunit C [Planctomycetota bacterium]|nr:NADH-quinone oxidoreductase subunit C [Planctomycetota bacterium]